MADWLRYSNQGAIRNKPLSEKLVDAMSFLPDMGVEMEVFSGGQDAKGKGGRRTGSTRHDHGDAADVFFYKDGKRLDWSDPMDKPIVEEIVSRARRRGITGIGAGQGYMRPGSMHIGFGNEAVWGAGGKSANAPSWLKKAFNNTEALDAIQGAVPTPAMPSTALALNRGSTAGGRNTEMPNIARILTGSTPAGLSVTPRLTDGGGVNPAPRKDAAFDPQRGNIYPRHGAIPADPPIPMPALARYGAPVPAGADERLMARTQFSPPAMQAPVPASADDRLMARTRDLPPPMQSFALFNPLGPAAPVPMPRLQRQQVAPTPAPRLQSRTLLDLLTNAPTPASRSIPYPAARPSGRERQGGFEQLRRRTTSLIG